MKNKLNFYTKLISSILDSCCSYIVTVENSDIKLISFFGNKPFDLDTLKLLLNNFDPTKKSFSILDVKDFKTTIKNVNFISKNINSIGYLPILGENKITIGYLITGFNKPFSFIKSEEKTVSLISNKIAEKLQENKSITTKKLNTSESNELLLQDSNKKYKYLFDNNPSPLFIFDFETLEIIDCNIESLMLYGYSREEFLQLTIKDIRPEEDIALILETTENESAYGEIHKKVWRHLKKNGDLMYVEITGHLLDYNNRRSSLVLVNDITEKKELEKLFKKTNKLTRIGGWEMDLLNNTLFWSDITKEIIEVSPDYIPEIETAITFYKNDSNRTKITEYVQQAINTGKPWDDEFQIVTAKGNNRWIRVMGEAEFVNGNCIRIYGSMQDIDERKIIEQQKNSLLTTLEKSLNEIYIFDAETLKFSYVNQGALLNIGYSEQEIMELTPVDLKPEFTATKFNQVINRLVTKEKEKIIFFTNHKRKNGSLYPVEIHLQFVEEANNNRFLAVILDITERKKAEEEVRSAIEKAQESDARFKAYTQQSPIAIYTTDINGDCIYANETWLEMAAMQLEDALGKGWINALHPEDLDYVTDNWYKSIESNGEWNYEYRFLNSNKNIIWVNGSAKKLFNDKNEHIGYLGSNVDITERKKAEEKFSKAADALQKALNDTNKIMDSSLDIICVVDKEGCFVKVSAACEATLGYKPEELIGKPLINYVYNIDNEKTQITADVVMSGKSIKHFENRYIRKDGSLVPMEWTARWDEHDKLRYGVARDITERKIAEEEIKSTEERRKLIMNAALDAIICIDKDGMITFWNPQAEQIFGWNENEVMGKVLSAIIIPEHYRSMHANGMKNYLKTGKGNAINVLLQLSAIRRNGIEFPIELTVLPLLQDGEEFFCAFIRDITEHKIHQDQLLKLNKDLNKQKTALVASNKELEQFAYVASHDLQEPLRMVTSFLTLLEKRYTDVLDEKGLKYINFAVEGSKSMRQIILDILEFSRINNNEENYEFIDLKDIIKDVSLLQGHCYPKV